MGVPSTALIYTSKILRTHKTAFLMTFGMSAHLSSHMHFIQMISLKFEVVIVSNLQIKKKKNWNLGKEISSQTNN